MSSALNKPEEIFDSFCREVEHLFGKEVVSIVLFGSAATDEYIPKKSDINFLVVLTPKGMDRIQSAQGIVDRWKKWGIGLPLFLTKEYIQESLDSFPIEFLNMQLAYRVIKGEDVLKNLKIKKADLRLQCERELKGSLLKLRQGFIETGGRAKSLRLLIVQSIVAFSSIFKGLLYLKGKEVPVKKQDALLAGCREFGLDEGLFCVLLSVKKYETKLKKGQLESKIKRYIKEIEKLSEMVDRMKMGEKK